MENSWITQLYEQMHAWLHTKGGWYSWTPNKE